MPAKPWLSALGVVLGLNAVFLGLALWTADLDREPLRARVRQAFADTELVRKDYLPFDSRRGFHQYDECLILQMLTNRETTLSRDAVAPALYVRDTTYTDYCATLHRLVVAGEAPSEFLAHRYARYWHGQMPLAAALLRIVDLGTARWILKVASYLGLLLLLWAALLRGAGPARITGATIAVAGLLVWGLPYFAPTFSHGPGDMLVVLGLIGLLGGRDRLRAPSRFIPYCAAYGALVVYLEFLTGQLPTAAALLFAVSYAVAVSRDGATRRQAWLYAATGLLAFGLGATVTVLFKQVLAAAVIGSQPLETFGAKLKQYTGSTGGEHRLPDFLLPFGRFLRRGEVLTYGHEIAAHLLYLLSGLAWVLAGVLTLMSVGHAHVSASRSDFLALAAGAAVVVIWVLVFRNHAFVHAGFMVRIMIVPVALGWAALLWQIQERRIGRGPAGRPSPAGDRAGGPR